MYFVMCPWCEELHEVDHIVEQDELVMCHVTHAAFQPGYVINERGGFNIVVTPPDPDRELVNAMASFSEPILE